MTRTEELRAEATAHRQEAYDSFERCDTDGALSQHSNELIAQQLDRQADIEENDGRATVVALFDTEGNLVPAKYVETRFGMAFGLLPDDNPDGRFVGWFNPSKARNPERARAADAKKGFYVGYVGAKAKAVISGGNIACLNVVAKRIDGGFSRDVEIIDNGWVGGQIAEPGRWYNV